MTALRYHAGARTDVAEAATWYEGHAGGGASLLSAIESAVSQLLELPGLGAPVPGFPPTRSIRRLLVPHFPYWIIYSEANAELIILALAHHSRDPGYWTGREAG